MHIIFIYFFYAFSGAQRKIKPVSGSLVLKLVTCACFRKAVFCLSCAYFLTNLGLEGFNMLI